MRAFIGVLAKLRALLRQRAVVYVVRGFAVLSGLLRNQENFVLSFYRPQGLKLRETLRDGPWSALVLERGRG